MERRGEKSPRQGASSSVDETVATISANYREFQYRFVEFLTDHLSDCSRTFGGDLQQMLVLAIIGQVELHARTRPAQGDGMAEASITASRISDVSGIPRETVRRKLAMLETRGWIARRPDGSWRLATTDGDSAARRDLGDLDKRGIARWAGLLASVKPLL